MLSSTWFCTRRTIEYGASLLFFVSRFHLCDFFSFVSLHGSKLEQKRFSFSFCCFTFCEMVIYRRRRRSARAFFIYYMLFPSSSSSFVFTGTTDLHTHKKSAPRDNHLRNALECRHGNPTTGRCHVSSTTAWPRHRWPSLYFSSKQFSLLESFPPHF